MWLLIFIPAAAVLAGLLCALAALLRVRWVNPLNPRLLSKSSWKCHVPEVLGGVQWLDDHVTEELWLRSGDGLRLYGRFCPAENPRGTVLRMHGYRSEGRVDFATVAQQYHKLGLNLLLVDQRAHGKSGGHLITYGIRERYDCQLWAQYAASRFGPEHPLVLSGISMGAATVLMASNLPLPQSVRCVVADCGFTSPWAIIGHVMERQYHLPAMPFLYLTGWWARLLTGQSLRSCSATDCVAQTKLPVLFYHGKRDHFVPWEMTQQNYDACRSEKELVLVEGASHGLSFLTDPDRCAAALASFLEHHL